MSFTDVTEISFKYEAVHTDKKHNWSILEIIPVDSNVSETNKKNESNPIIKDIKKEPVKMNQPIFRSKNRKKE